MIATDSKAPETIMEWVRGHRLRRRAQFVNERAFRQHMRWLFRGSGFVRYKGWKPAQLEATLEETLEEPACKADPIGRSQESSAATEGAAGDRNDKVDAFVESPGSQRRCIDCGDALPPDRQRAGRCQRCRKLRAKETAKERMRRRRARNVSECYGTSPSDGALTHEMGPQSDDLPAGRAQCLRRLGRNKDASWYARRST